MRIERVDSWVLRFPMIQEGRDADDCHFEFVGVNVLGENGHTGMGFTYTIEFGGAEAIKALLDHVLIPRVIGKDVFEYRKIWHELWWATHRLGRGISMMGISALDIAFWDLMAKAQGLPLAKALGQAKDRVPTYGSGKASPLLTTEELVRTSVEYAEEGFNAIKLRVGRNPQLDLVKVAAVRKAVGPEMRLMCDANERMDLPTALWLGKRLAEYDIYWLEEPIQADHVAGHRALCEALPISVAVGEHLFSRWEFTPYIEQRAAHILQPDVCLIGGVTEFMRLGETAGAHGLPISPHYLTELHIHLAAALPNSIYVEYFPFMDQMLKHPLKVENSHVLVPEVPGHGIEFHDWVWQQYRVR